MINYVVCCWFGPRGSKKYSALIEGDKFYFINQHLEFLNTYSKGDIEKATFVVNSRPDEDTETVEKFFAEVKLDSGIKVDYLFRDNKDSNGLVRGSYGAWNDVMVKDITADTNIEKFLMFEDDYILVNEDCVYPYIERCTKESPLVCSYVMKPNQWCIEHLSHATPVCVDKMIAKKIYDEYKEVLYFEQPNPSLSDYSNICNVQVYCQKHFTNKGYKLVDVLDEYSTGYLYCNQPGFSEELLVVFGDSQNATLVIPIGYMDYEYEDPYALMPNIHTR
tara:strand:+ start:105 stop:935 length:831 start_codon:yes stop_codon:yes gene_type:complete